jgi:hypothetical protein
MVGEINTHRPAPALLVEEQVGAGSSLRDADDPGLSLDALPVLDRTAIRGTHGARSR